SQGPFLQNPAHPYTKALLEATSDPDPENVRTFKKVPGGEPPSLLNPPAGCRFHPRCEFKIEGLCDVDVPPDFEIKEGHLTACWLYKDNGKN
ncbi:MAG TPA: oligopeptide ABC transporter ATP-binding protein, partial [Firmicutes bacterium]|nr:oligopeptide ABC transporter ATP-binding protein [Bacillota bacterium]